jgi:hypothetical protein
MAKYEVAVSFVFSGSFSVEADNSFQAADLVRDGCHARYGGIDTYLPEETLDWEFDAKPTKIIVSVRRKA